MGCVCVCVCVRIRASLGRGAPRVGELREADGVGVEGEVLHEVVEGLLQDGGVVHHGGHGGRLGPQRDDEVRRRPLGGGWAANTKMQR